MITEHICGMLIDLSKQKFGDRIDATKLRGAVENYCKHREVFDTVGSIDQEIDFEGLILYIHEDLMDEMENYLRTVNAKKRGIIREHIIEKACKYAQAQTPIARHRVTRFVSGVIKVVKEFYKQKVPKELFVLSNEIVDSINEHADQNQNEITERLEVLKDCVESLQSNISSVTLIPKNFSEKEKLLQKNQELISTEHPLFPDYGYTFDGKHLHSTPRSNEALEKHPPMLFSQGILEMDGKNVDCLNDEVVDYAYRHQKPITVTVTDARKLLGRILDPDQSEAEQLIGEKIVLKPREFPAAVPCSIAAGDTTYYDYILIRQQEILENGVRVFGNKDQNANCYFEITVHFLDPETSRFDFQPTILSDRLEDMIQFEKFSLALWEGQPLQIKNLKTGDIFLDGIAYRQNEEEKEDLRISLEILEMLKSIEEYFGVSFILPSEYDANDYHIIKFTADLIRDGEIVTNWKQKFFVGPVSEEFRKKLKENGNNPMILKFRVKDTYHICGVDLTLEYESILNHVLYKNYDKLVQIADLLEDGQSITVDFVPGEDDTVLYRLVT